MNDEQTSISDIQDSTPSENVAEPNLDNTPSQSEESTNDTSLESTSTKPQYTQLEKATHSFKKQLTRQAKKYERLLAERDKRLQELQQNPTNNTTKKSREEFTNDEDYIDYLVTQRMHANMQAYELQQQQQQEYNQSIQDHQAKQQEYVAKHFANPVDYTNAIARAMNSGLGKIIDSDSDLANFIIRNENGPGIMYKLATEPELVKKLFSNTTRLDRQFMIRSIAESLNKPADVQAVQRPVVGRANSTKNSNDMFNDNKALLNYINNHR